MQRGEIIAFPLALIALALVFGSLVAAVTPITIGGSSVIAILASIFLLGRVTDLSIFVLNMATMLGLGLADGLLALHHERFREELPVARSPRPSRDGRHGGPGVFFSGLTVLIGLAGLMIFAFMFLRSVGIAGALVVSFSVLAAVTLLPALLGIVGARIDALRDHPDRDA